MRGMMPNAEFFIPFRGLESYRMQFLNSIKYSLALRLKEM